MTHALRIVQIKEAATRSGILKPGDVEIPFDAIPIALETLRDCEGDEGVVAELGDVDSLRGLLPNLPAPYKRVVLSASHIHNCKRYRAKEWSPRQHLEECLRQNRAYFRRRGVATSVEMDNKAAFGDKGITGTANDRDVFVAFMKRIGLEDAVSPNAVAAGVMKGLRADGITRDQHEDTYGALFTAMSQKPGQNIDRPIFDEIIKGTSLEKRADAAYKVLCDLTKKYYTAINDRITKAHSLLQVSLTLEQEGIARFALNNPFGLAIPYESSLFRVYELDEAMHVARVCPTFFSITGGDEDDDPFEVFPVSHGTFSDLAPFDKFRIGEVYVPVTIEQLARVGQFAIEHCKFDVTVLTDDDTEGDEVAGSGGAIRTITNKIAGLELPQPEDKTRRPIQRRQWPTRDKDAGPDKTPAGD